MGRIISHVLDTEEVEGMLAKIDAAPKISWKDPNEWGHEQKSTCPCGGTITAIRSEFNGHYHAACDKCGWRMME